LRGHGLTRTYPRLMILPHCWGISLLERARPDEDISEADVTGRWRPVMGLKNAPWQQVFFFNIKKANFHVLVEIQFDFKILNTKTKILKKKIIYSLKHDRNHHVFC